MSCCRLLPLLCQCLAYGLKLANLRCSLTYQRVPEYVALFVQELQAGVYAQQSRDDGQSLDLSEDREFYNDSEATAGKVAERRLSSCGVPSSLAF